MADVEIFPPTHAARQPRDPLTGAWLTMGLRSPVVDVAEVFEPSEPPRRSRGRTVRHVASGLSRFTLASAIVALIAIGAQLGFRAAPGSVADTAQTVSRVDVRDHHVAIPDIRRDGRWDAPAHTTELAAHAPIGRAIETASTLEPTPAPRLVNAPVLLRTAPSETIQSVRTTSGPPSSERNMSAIASLPLPARNPRFGRIVRAEGRHRFTSAPLDEELVLVRRPTLRASGRVPVRRASARATSPASRPSEIWRAPALNDLPSWARRAFDAD